jgi:hypothetical protein
MELSPIQSKDIHPDILTNKMLEDLRTACGAEQVLIIASKDNTTEIRTFGACGHEIINMAHTVISFGLNELEEEVDKKLT